MNGFGFLDLVFTGVVCYLLGTLVSYVSFRSALKAASASQAGADEERKKNDPSYWWKRGGDPFEDVDYGE